MVTLGKQLQKLMTALEEYNDGSATLRRDNSQVTHKKFKNEFWNSIWFELFQKKSKPDAKAVVEYIGARLSNRIKVHNFVIILLWF